MQTSEAQKPLLKRPYVVLALVSIVGDSSVFSTGITELAPPRNIGAALGLQSLLGFGITIISIALFGFIVDHVGWELAFLSLGIGAVVGTLAMVWLRRLPEAAPMAAGKR